MHRNNQPVPSIVEGYHPRPLREWMRMARELGFELRVDHEPEEFTVYVMLMPKTRSARLAVDRALGDSCDGIIATTVYDKNSKALKDSGLHPPPRDNTDKAFLVGLDDSAAYAMSMAQAAMRRSDA